MSIAFAPNTHEFLIRILSCIEKDPVRVLSTDAEFHSFARQSQRLEEAGHMQVTRIPAEPFESFQDRFLDAAAGGAPGGSIRTRCGCPLSAGSAVS